MSKSILMNLNLKAKKQNSYDAIVVGTGISAGWHLYPAYFSSNSSTLPAAEATGNMALRPHSIVNRVLYDAETDKASGVEVIDAETDGTRFIQCRMFL